MPRGGGKMPGLTPSINQHLKKKLDSFKDLKRKLPRMFGPKGFDPNIFASKLAGFAAPINIRGQECRENPQFYPMGLKIWNYQGQENISNQIQGDNSEIPHPLCPDCKNLFGLVGDNDSEKLRYL